MNEYKYTYFVSCFHVFISVCAHMCLEPPSTPQVDVTFSRVPLAGLDQDKCVLQGVSWALETSYGGFHTWRYLKSLDGLFQDPEIQ